MAITPIVSPGRGCFTKCLDYSSSSETTYNITLEENALYFLPTVTSVTLQAGSSMTYCGMDLTTGSSAPTISYPSTWVFDGDDCDSGVFTANASTRYRMAIEYSPAFSTYVCIVVTVSVLSDS